MMFTYCPRCGTKDSVKEIDVTQYTCESCLWTFWNNPRAAIAIVLLRDDGMFLAAKRGKQPNMGKYDMPGGFAEFDEQPEACAARELLEETGLRADSFQLAGVYYNHYTDFVSTFDLIMVVRSWQGEPKAADDVADLEWKPLDFMNSDQFAVNYPGLSDKLQDMLAGNPSLNA